MKARDTIKSEVLRDHIAAISCGVCKGTAVLDLDYAEDSEADTDANFVMTGSGNIVEIQATLHSSYTILSFTCRRTSPCRSSTLP